MFKNLWKKHSKHFLSPHKLCAEGTIAKKLFQQCIVTTSTKEITRIMKEILQQGMIMPKFRGRGRGCKDSSRQNIQQKINIFYTFYVWTRVWYHFDSLWWHSAGYIFSQQNILADNIFVGQNSYKLNRWNDSRNRLRYSW